MISKEIFDQQEIFSIYNEQIKLWINPADGMNIYEIWHQNKALIQFDRARYEANQTCSVMTLFPTPNRVKNNHFTFEGITYPMENHGILKHAKFKVVQQVASRNGGILRASLDITNNHDDGNEYYYLFPFMCTLTLEIELHQNQIYYRYHLQNKDNKNLPYGIGIHPFFHKPKDEELLIQVYASAYMEHNKEHFPTGRILPVTKSYDLQKAKKVDDLALDDVYLVHPPDIAAVIHYQDKKVLLSSSQEFEKLVVYTPKNLPYFCLENQTCSTDAINMYNKGYVKESSLINLGPNDAKQGFIKIVIASSK